MTPTEKRAYQAAYYLANKDRLCAAAKAWRLDNLTRKRAYNAAWAAANPEKVRASAAKLRADHPEKLAVYAAKWRAANRDLAHARSAAWRQDNAARSRAIARRRRARLRDTRSPGVAPDVWAEILESFGGHCAYCCALATTVDHVVPLSKGGLDEPANVVPACRSCNSSKGTKEVFAWMKSRKHPAVA